jgi:hypothetical protein
MATKFKKKKQYSAIFIKSLRKFLFDVVNALRSGGIEKLIRIGTNIV